MAVLVDQMGGAKMTPNPRFRFTGAVHGGPSASKKGGPTLWPKGFEPNQFASSVARRAPHALPAAVFTDLVRKSGRPQRLSFVPAPTGAPVPRKDADFITLRTLGKGNFGTVSLVRCRADGLVYALKQSTASFRSDRDRSLALREVQAAKAIGPCPALLPIHGAWLDEENRLCTLSEFCEGGSVAAAVSAQGPLTAIAAASAVAQVALALAHMHAFGIAHMDVKPDNILLVRPLHAEHLAKNRPDRLETPPARPSIAGSDAPWTIASAATSCVHMGGEPGSPAVGVSGVDCLSSPGIDSTDAQPILVRLGDLGQASAVDGSMKVEEGDGRYASLGDSSTEFPMAGDVFSLAVSWVEMISSVDGGSSLSPGVVGDRGLPRHAARASAAADRVASLRDGILPPATAAAVPRDLHPLLRAMVSPDPATRPSPAAVVSVLRTFLAASAPAMWRATTARLLGAACLLLDDGLTAHPPVPRDDAHRPVANGRAACFDSAPRAGAPHSQAAVRGRTAPRAAPATVAQPFRRGRRRAGTTPRPAPCAEGPSARRGASGESPGRRTAAPWVVARSFEFDDEEAGERGDGGGVAADRVCETPEQQPADGGDGGDDGSPVVQGGSARAPVPICGMAASAWTGALHAPADQCGAARRSGLLSPSGTPRQHLRDAEAPESRGAEFGGLARPLFTGAFDFSEM